jgi:hypothetical protein
MRDFLIAVTVAVALTAGFEALARISETPAAASQDVNASYLQSVFDGTVGTPKSTQRTPVANGDGNFLKLEAAWYRGHQVEYYDFGDKTGLTQGSSVAVAPIYVFITGLDANGNPDFVEGQHNIVDVRPGDVGYSDLWQVILVTVPAGYKADSMTSAAAVASSGFGMTSTDILVNCPIVYDGTELERGEPLVQGWYKGEVVFYPDFGPNPAVAMPVFSFVTEIDAEGSPQFVERQLDIVDSIPTDPGYSAFRRVNLVTVPLSYEPNSIRSVADLRASGYEVTETDVVLNAPIIELGRDESNPARR